MSPEVILLGLFAVPVLLLFFLRINAALVFASLCIGGILVKYSGHDAASIVAGAATSAHATSSTIQLGLLLAPAVLMMLFMLNTVSGKSKRLVNIVPALATGLLTVLLVVPLLPPGLSHNVVASSLWQKTLTYQSGVVALGTLVALVFLLLQRPKASHEEKHKHHK